MLNVLKQGEEALTENEAVLCNLAVANLPIESVLAVVYVCEKASVSELGCDLRSIRLL